MCRTWTPSRRIPGARWSAWPRRPYRWRIPGRPFRARRGHPKPESCEYLNGDTHNLSLTYRPKAGWRHMPIAHRRTIQDVAHRIRRLEDEACPYVPVVRLELDNMNSHSKPSLCRTFTPVQTGPIAKRPQPHLHNWTRQLTACGGEIFHRTRLSLPAGTQRRRGRLGETGERQSGRPQLYGSRHQLAFHQQGGKAQPRPPPPMPFKI